MQNTAFASLLLGLLTTASPCILPLYPGFLAYLSNQHEVGGRKYFLGVFVLTGVLSMMLVVGGLIAWMAIPIGRFLFFVIPLADLLLMILGISLLLNYSPFTRIPQIQLPALDHPYARAFVYGLLYGPLAFPCSGPMIVAIFAVSLTVQDVFDQLRTFLWFGLGLGIPLLALSFLSVALQRQLTTFFARHGRILNIIGGMLMIGISVYDVHKNWPSLQLFWKNI
jgi:cytochrome c-type biogenesis protein